MSGSRDRTHKGARVSSEPTVSSESTDGATQPELAAWAEPDEHSGFFAPRPEFNPGLDVAEPRLWAEWEEASEPSKPEGPDSDGPFPAAVDDENAPEAAAGPAVRGPKPQVRSAAPEPPRGEVAAFLKEQIGLSHRLDLRAHAVLPPRIDRGRRRSSEGRPEPREAPPRRYPKMRALLGKPDEVPEGDEPFDEPKPPPVPGTFIPNPPPSVPRASSGDLDAMLALMADGLTLGQSADGATEVRVTLRDEYFAGTELRIAMDAGEVSATLIPPSRDVYWQLDGEVGALRDRLQERGLRVARLNIEEPTG